MPSFPVGDIFLSSPWLLWFLIGFVSEWIQCPFPKLHLFLEFITSLSEVGKGGTDCLPQKEHQGVADGEMLCCRQQQEEGSLTPTQSCWLFFCKPHPNSQMSLLMSQRVKCRVPLCKSSSSSRIFGAWWSIFRVWRECAC